MYNICVKRHSTLKTHTMYILSPKCVPYYYTFQYPLTNYMIRYLENKQLKNGGLNTLRVPKTGKVCHVFDPGAHTGRVEAKDGNIIETQHLNIESKHQLKAHCAII